MIDISAELESMLDDYVENVNETCKEESRKAAKRAVKKLKSSSPKRSGDYAKSWRSKTLTTTTGRKYSVVYVKAPHHRLSHLLEYGHATPNGGRTKAHNFIRPVEDSEGSVFVQSVKERLK